MSLWRALVCFLGSLLLIISCGVDAQSVVRYNQLGYTPRDIKVAVVASRDQQFKLLQYQLKNIKTGQSVIRVQRPTEKDYGAYGPFRHSFRINLSSLVQPGEYQLIVNDSVRSGIIRVDHTIYKGLADKCLQFLREQRCGYNPVTKDSCHSEKDYSLGAAIPDNTIIDVSGGWHNAGSRNQQVITAAAATWYLLAAYEHFPALFNDQFGPDATAITNDKPDILDEAKWGLDWLIKMHPAKDVMYKQVDDSVGHPGSHGRPVYAVKKTDVSQVAGALSSAYASGSLALRKTDLNYAERLSERAVNAYEWAKQSGAEKNTGVLELAASELYKLKGDRQYQDDLNNYFDSKKTGKDPLFAVNYVNNSRPDNRDCYRLKAAIEKVKAQANSNAFLNGLPFTSGSNNLLVAFLNQCSVYSENCKDSAFTELEQANVDWLFGTNPWGAVMVSAFPGSSVHHPYGAHPAFMSHFGLVNGPVTPLLYKNSPGSSLLKKDAYASWQSELAVYHDDAADYVTNEPTIDGTAALIYLLAFRESEALKYAPNGLLIKNGVIVRGDSASKKIAILFTGDQNGQGVGTIRQILGKEKALASFFLGTSYVKRNAGLISQLRAAGHYIGATAGDPISNDDLVTALQENYNALKAVGVSTKTAPVLLAAGGASNNDVADWADGLDLEVINPTPGTLSTSDNTVPGTAGYVGSDSIFQNVMAKARQRPYGLNGYFLQFHIGADAARTDKFYMLLPLLLQQLKAEGYELVRADQMLGYKPIPVKKAATKKKVVSKKKRKRR